MDNKITLRTGEPHVVILELNPWQVDEFLDFFDIELEVLQGDTQPMQNGQIKITVQVSEQKAEFVYDFLLTLFSQPDNMNLS